MPKDTLQKKMAAKQKEINDLMDPHGIVRIDNFEQYNALSEELRQLRIERREARRRAALQSKTVVELKEMLSGLGLSQMGKKADLITRIRDYANSPQMEAKSEEE